MCGLHFIGKQLGIQKQLSLLELELCVPLTVLDMKLGKSPELGTGQLIHAFYKKMSTFNEINKNRNRSNFAMCWLGCK